MTTDTVVFLITCESDVTLVLKMRGKRVGSRTELSRMVPGWYQSGPKWYQYHVSRPYTARITSPGTCHWLVTETKTVGDWISYDSEYVSEPWRLNQEWHSDIRRDAKVSSQDWRSGLASSCCYSCCTDFPLLKSLNRETVFQHGGGVCLLYTSPSPRDATLSRMPSSA